MIQRRHENEIQSSAAIHPNVGQPLSAANSVLVGVAAWGNTP
jgi:hypothetical protein